VEVKRTAIKGQGERRYCDEMPESRNSEIRSEVDFVRKELLRRLHDNI
jgi:hypothetical protein